MNFPARIRILIFVFALVGGVVYNIGTIWILSGILIPSGGKEGKM